MRTQKIFALFVGAAIASIIVASAFFIFTFYLGDIYMAATGTLVHANQSTSRGLLHVLAQACAIGGAGGYLFVLQIIFEIAHSDKSWLSSQSTIPEHALVGFLIPIKGVIAGAIAGGVIGGVLFAIGGLESLAKFHLLILGLSCLAGYSEQILQKIIQRGSHHADHV